jgi:hypothetical protein
MVALTSKGRKAGASSGYPMPDKKHAGLAKSGASHAYHVGNISKATENKIDAKANRVLGKGKKGK